LEKNGGRIINAPTHLTDWIRPNSTTSPHLFKEADELEILFIDKELERNKYAMFIRKIAPEFPDEILKHYIYEQSKANDDNLDMTTPNDMLYSIYVKKWVHYVGWAIVMYVLYIMLA